jgi:hypothetical protein
MKNTHLFFLSILILIGIGCRKEDKGNMMEEDRFTEQQLLGTWDGSFNQVGYGDFTGSVTITELKVDEVTATGHYNSPPCPFQWIYMALKDLAALSLAELWGVYRFLARMANE